LADDSVDTLFLNQVIEHVHDTDHLLEEIRRVLKKPGGLLVVSTENLSGWHNILSLVLGWQPFSSTNLSETKLGIGNPLAAHRGEPGPSKSMQHLRLFAPRGLAELMSAYGFAFEEMVGSGYFPLWGRLASVLSGIDARHAAFITVKARLT
jgi:2-polyprenyl-3-methyl-5-hydroxy-6-metoxy-1,4-benzoquinol methylase